tara:strand:+ start:2458 stop:2856 length:399 start_codon:yes stop_codon:yes gene_type:complete
MKISTHEGAGEQIVSQFLKKVYEADGLVSLDYLTTVLHLNKGELAPAFGLSRDALSKQKRMSANRTQKRLGHVVQILNRVLPWTGSVASAWAWYRSQPLPGFGDLTAEQLVKDGYSQAVLDYLEEIANGGYA